MRFCLLAPLGLSAAALAAAPAPPPAAAPRGYDDAVVLVDCGAGGTGSGVAVRRGPHEFVWTAAHVVEDLEAVETVVPPETGTPRVVASYREPKLVRQVYKGGVLVGETARYAEVIRYSDLEGGYDLALLRTRDPVCPAGAEWAEATPPVGAALYHVGSPFGRSGYNSFVPGTVAGRFRPKRGLRHAPDARTLEMAQYSLAGGPGSSGGPVFDARSRKVVGLLTQGMVPQPTHMLGVPVEVVRRFAREADCLWAVDPAVPVPDGEDWRRSTPRTTPLPKPKP